jgi:hypothetical protein
METIVTECMDLVDFLQKNSGGNEEFLFEGKITQN